MDQYYQYHHQPHNQWRQPPPPPPPAQQQPSICPVCSVPHYPFCPPYPPYHHQSPNYLPHYARPGFDPYQPPPPPPPAVPNHPPHYVDAFSDPRSWPRDPNYGYDYGAAAGGDIDRSYKRPRVEEFGSGPGPGRTLSEDQRRLKLIRDHGGASVGGFNQENKYVQNNVNNNSDGATMPPRSSEMYSIEDSLNNHNDYSNNNNYNYNHKDSAPAAVNNWQGYEQRIGGYGKNMAPQPPPPPLPASPPPPLPAEPPVQHHPSSAYSSSPNSSYSLFPIPVSSSTTAHSTYPLVPEPYYQNKPPIHASVGFIREVVAAFLIIIIIIIYFWHWCFNL